MEENAKDNSKAKKFDELEAKNNFLNDTIETMKKNIEELKNQKQKEKEDFMQEISKLETELGQVKCELADNVFEKEEKITKCRRYITILEKKLLSLGFKLKPKKI